MKKGRGCVRWAAVVLAAVILIVGSQSLMQPGKIRYRNVKEVDWNGIELVMDGRNYSFYGPLEQDMKRGRLLAYARDDDGYYWEFFSVEGKGKEWLIAKHRIIMGDTFLMKEN